MSASTSPRKRRWPWITALTILLILLLAWRGFSHAVLRVVEQHTLTTGPNGPTTPATFGTPFEHVSIPSGQHQDETPFTTAAWRLDANLVNAPASCPDAPALLLFHGTGETISDWALAQSFLYQHCVSSLVFDPTGSGNSPRPANIALINDDARAAYAFFAQRFAGHRLYVLAHSLGNAFMLPAAPHFSPAPLGLIEANGFASLHAIAGEGKPLLYRALIDTTPDLLDNLKAARKIHIPILVIVSDADRRNPMHNGQEIYAAAPEPKHFIILHGFNHNDLYQNPTEAWWQPTLSFIHAPIRPVSTHP